MVGTYPYNLFPADLLDLPELGDKKPKNAPGIHWVAFAGAPEQPLVITNPTLTSPVQVDSFSRTQAASASQVESKSEAGMLAFGKKSDDSTGNPFEVFLVVDDGVPAFYP